MSKTLMQIEFDEEMQNVKGLKEFAQLIAHPRVYFNNKTDELFYYVEDSEELTGILPDQISFEDGYDMAWGFDDGGWYYKANQITIEGEELVSSIKEELEIMYTQNIKPNFSMESLGKNIMIRHLENMLTDLKNDKIEVES